MTEGQDRPTGPDGSADAVGSADPVGVADVSAEGSPRSGDSAGAVDDAPTGDPAEPVAERAHADLIADLAAAAANIGAGDLSAAETDLAAAIMDEDLQLATVARERDDYLDALRRLQADFENYKKRTVKQQHEQSDRGAEALVAKLLPVCDTADLAIAHGGGEEVKQVWTALFDALEREGLERIDPVGVAFDPTVHEAVAHEPGEGRGEPEVVEVMRAGYRWKGRVLRPAMVKVRG